MIVTDELVGELGVAPGVFTLQEAYLHEYRDRFLIGESEFPYERFKARFIVITTPIE